MNAQKFIMHHFSAWLSAHFSSRLLLLWLNGPYKAKTGNNLNICNFWKLIQRVHGSRIKTVVIIAAVPGPCINHPIAVAVRKNEKSIHPFIFNFWLFLNFDNVVYCKFYRSHRHNVCLSLTKELVLFGVFWSRINRKSCLLYTWIYLKRKKHKLHP